MATPRGEGQSHANNHVFAEKAVFFALFVTQFLGAFNDNLFRTAMVMLVIYSIYDDPTREAQFSTMAQGLFILPFFLLSAISGQLADSHDKAGLIRIVKSAEIIIMFFGAAGLMLHNVPLMLSALFAMGVHSTFLGPSNMQYCRNIWIKVTYWAARG